MPTALSMETMAEVAKFFNNGGNISRMKELADKEAEVDEKLKAFGGIERAKALEAEAEEVRRRVDASRGEIIGEANEEADRIKRMAQTELANAEFTRKRAQAEFASREEKVEADERDIIQRKKALEQGEMLLRSGQEKLKIAQREMDELGNRLQAKLAAIKQVAYG